MITRVNYIDIVTSMSIMSDMSDKVCFMANCNNLFHFIEIWVDGHYDNKATKTFVIE